MPRLRCAIYTRKSTEEGLDQDFNSLDAQREACEAYIESQKSEGWKLVRTRYDDGGLSGGTMNRPALVQLLEDVRADKVDIIVVYKVDRLTRALADFARIVDTLDNNEASFVSVTQAFNTTTSMGRLTLNVLLSFAQFEREVTAERIRDKIAASRKKGMWMGGPVPLGYEVVDKKLIILTNEAQTVRSLFKLSLELNTGRDLEEEAARLGYRTKQQIYATGRKVGGCVFTRGRLYHLLRNPLYIGRVRHKENSYPGQQEAIIDETLWTAVQAKLDGRVVRTKDQIASTNRPLLLGLLHDEAGTPLTTNHAVKNGRRYRYYISRSLNGKKSASDDKGWRLPSLNIESLVLKELEALLSDPVTIMTLLESDQPPAMKEVLTRNALERLLPTLLQYIRLTKGEITFRINLQELAIVAGIKNRADTDTFDRSICVQIKRRGVEMKIIIPGNKTHHGPADHKLCHLIGRSHKWIEQLKSGEHTSIAAIAQAENMDPGDVSRFMQLAFLAPDIVETILKGEQSPDLTLEKLKRLPDLPLAWTDQRIRLGL